MIPLDEIEPAQWNGLLKNSSQATVFHTLEWMRVWTETFPTWQGRFAVVNQGDTLIAGMPLIEVRKFGLTSYYSMPYGTYGGFIGTVDSDPTRGIISRTLKKITGPRTRVWIDDLSGTMKAVSSNLSAVQFATHITRLGVEPEKLWREKIHKKIKEQVRESERRGVEVRLLDTEAEIPVCHKMLAETAERHGDRVRFSVALFENIFRIMSDNGNLRWTVAVRGQTYLSFLLSFLYNKTIYFWANASFTDALPYRPNNALFWKTMEWGCSNGFEYANLGATPVQAAGLIRWKERLGGEMLLYDEYRWRSWLWKLLKR
jgi:CelD/BcsL family acetyltransferase involved in cellulose biosynthesis